MYLEADIKTKVISGTRNHEFNNEMRFTFDKCPPEVRNSLNCTHAVLIVNQKPVIVQLWGKQVADKKPVNVAPKRTVALEQSENCRFWISKCCLLLAVFELVLLVVFFYVTW